MKFPSLREYKAAISDTENINIPFFKSNTIKIFLNKRGSPYMSVGGFGAVFQFKDKDENQYALKVFTRDAEGRAKRYKALHDTLQITKFPFMVDFHYVEEGIKVGKKFYPVVVMQWGEGVPLDVAVGKDLEDDGKLQSGATIGGNLFLLAKTLQEWNMGHGDFQEGNLLIGNDDRIILIDYDGMFVPALEGSEANEVGLADYQHPQRDNDHFGPSIDDFSLLSILFQLAILAPEHWTKYHGDKRLVLKVEDYNDTKTSLLIQKGISSKEKHVKALAKLLVDSLEKGPLEISAVELIEKNKDIMGWLKFTEVIKPVHNYSSIITRVVSLTDEQVQDFDSKKLKLPAENVKAVQSGGSKVKPQKNRQDDKKGSWESVMDFFYEDDGDHDEDEQKHSTGDNDNILKKVKNSMMDLLFEEEEFETQTYDPGFSTTTIVSETGPPKSEDSKKQAENSVKKNTNSKSGKDSKTAPVPEWIKRRKGK